MSTVVSPNPPLVRIVSTAGQTSFAFNFWIKAETDLKVHVNGVLKTLTTDYTVSAVQQTGGANVVFGTGLALDDVVVIAGHQPAERTADYPANGKLSRDALNLESASYFAILKQNVRDVGRALRAALTSNVDTTKLSILETPEDRRVLVYDAAQNGFVNSDSDPDANVAATAASAAAASASASAASASASAAAASAANLTGTSTTSISIGTGGKSFTTQSGKSFTPGTWLLITSDANPANYIHGYVSTYSGTSLLVVATNVGGSGTHADWTIRVSGTQGAIGPAGGPIADGDYGDIVASSSGTVLTIDTSAVTTSKINNGAATLAKLDTTGTNGHVLTAQGSGNAPIWAAPAGGGGTPNAKAERGSSLTVTQASWTKVPYSTELFDTANAYDPTTNYRFTVPSGQGGKYFIRASAGWTGATIADAEMFYIAVYKNGSVHRYSTSHTSSSNVVGVQVSTLEDLSVSDYIEIYVYVEAASSADLIASGAMNYFDIYKVA
jgi:hypothetical protein